MSDDTNDTPPDVEETLTLDEFCRRLSSTDNRVELIGGFHYDEKFNNRVMDTATAFRARYEAFAIRPVL